MTDELSEKIIGATIEVHRILGQVIIEIKSIRELPEVATAQILSYLKATGLKRGLLINFGETHLTNGIKRISL